MQLITLTVVETGNTLDDLQPYPDMPHQEEKSVQSRLEEQVRGDNHNY
jgi:hypothetical protein